MSPDAPRAVDAITDEQLKRWERAARKIITTRGVRAPDNPTQIINFIRVDPHVMLSLIAALRAAREPAHPNEGE